MVFSMICMEIQIWGTGFNFGTHIFDTSLIYRPESKSSLNFAHGLEQFCRLSEIVINNIITPRDNWNWLETLTINRVFSLSSIRS